MPLEETFFYSTCLLTLCVFKVDPASCLNSSSKQELDWHLKYSHVFSQEACNEDLQPIRGWPTLPHCATSWWRALAFCGEVLLEHEYGSSGLGDRIFALESTEASQRYG